MTQPRPAAGTPVWVRRRKWPDGAHYEVSGVVLGGDDSGTWVGSRRGSRIIFPSRRERTALHDAVFFVPLDDWFLMHYWYEHPEVEIYVDICTPAKWSAEDVVVIDLDFDVIRWNAARGGGVELVDEDEFEAHRVELGYPEDLQLSARKAAADVLGRTDRAEFPFTRAAAEPWLMQLMQFGA